MRDRLLRFGVYAAVGLVTGLVVSGIEGLAVKVIFEHLEEQDIWVRAVAPTGGLVLAAVFLRIGRAEPLDPATSEEYIRAYHSRRPVTRLRDLPARFLAGCATVGMGGALGLEGPSIYSGSTIGASMQHRLRWLFTGKDSHMLLVAGAAAGVAAIFKTPATGVLFALEAPYQSDVARRALLPALVASATSYLTFITFYGTENIFPGLDALDSDVTFGRRELAGAVAVGVLAAGGAVLFSHMIKWAKRIQTRVPLWQRIPAAGLVLAALAVFLDAEGIADDPFTLGPGEPVFSWIDARDKALWLLVVVFAARLIASTATLAGGGVGGVFIPLAIAGILVGDIVGELIELTIGGGTITGTRFFSTIGLAAFLGAGYRTPLAAVMFVAESTGSTRFVVPALIAVAVSQVVIGGSSVSSYQRDTRVGHLERRFGMGITAALRTEVETVSADESLADYVWQHALVHRELAAVVVQEGRYVGVVRVADAVERDRDEWADTLVGEVMRTDIQPARITWTLREATAELEEHDLEQLPVVDAEGHLLGVVTVDDILNLDELLDETGS